MREAGLGLRGELAVCLTPGREDEGGGAGAEGWGESQSWEPLVAAPGCTWPLSAPAARGSQVPELPDLPSAVMKGGDAAERRAQLWGVGHLLAAPPPQPLFFPSPAIPSTDVQQLARPS